MVLRILRGALFLASAVGLALFVMAAVRTVKHRDALDPVERGVVERVERLASGGPLHLEPDPPGAPSLMPGLPAAAFAFGQLFGTDLWVARALALLAAVSVAALVLAVVLLETGSWTLGVSAVGFALMGHALLAGAPGAARTEAPMLLLVLLGFLALRLGTGLRGAALAALPLAAAFFTDPQAVWFVAAAFVALALGERGRLVAFTLSIAVLLGGGYAGLSQLLGPWFNFDAWDGPLGTVRASGTDPLHFVGNHLLGRLGVATLAAVLSFAMPTPPWRGSGGLWMCLGIAALLAGLASTQTTTWGPDALLPSVVALSILGPLSMQRVTRHLSAWPGSSRLGGQGFVLVAVALLFVVFLANITPS
jgi:hypothetical protein